MKYLIEVGKPMTVDYMQRLINSFQTHELPLMKRWEAYYNGDQDILKRTTTDSGKKLTNCVVNYIKTCCDTYNGYLGGIPIRYSGEGMDDVLEVLDYNDVHMEDSSVLLDALKYGISEELLYMDEDSKIRFKHLSPLECIPVYWNNLQGELAYVIRFYKQMYPDPSEDEFYVEVYGADKTEYYESYSGFTTFRKLGEAPNYFNQVPVSIFDLNERNVAVYDAIMSLQDSYNTLFSSAVSAVEEWSDSYLILTGAIADDENLTSMKEHRCLMLDTGCTAEFLTKSIADTEIQNLLKLTNDQIHKTGQFPDFNDEKFSGISSGISLKYRLISFENQASNIAARWKVALQKRIELICSILNLKGGEEVWRSVEIAMTRNLPISLEPTSVEELMQLKGLVSDKTLLGLLPFIKNADEELEAVKAQNEANMELYKFQNSGEINAYEDTEEDE